MSTPKLLVLGASDDFVAQVEEATSLLRPHLDVSRCAGFEDLDEVLDRAGPFDLMIAGPAVAVEDGLQELRRLRLRLPHVALILALERWRSGSLRQTVRTGAVDVLRLPVTDDVILEAVEQALEASAGIAHARLEGHDPLPAGPAHVVVVVSATGGCGKTFLTTNLGYYLQTQGQRRVCLIDFDLQFGELSTALRLKPRYTIADLVGEEEPGGSAVAPRLEEALATHATGFQVLAAPDDPVEADAIDAADVSRVIEAAKASFDCVIIDTPASLSGPVLTALEHADQIYAIATLDLPSVRNLGLLLTTLKQLKIPQDRVQLVLNKVESDVGMDVARVTKYFPQGFSIVIPYGRAVNRSLNMGMPMLAHAPRTDVSRALSSGLQHTLKIPGQAADGQTATGRRRSLFGRWRKPAATSQ